MAAPPLLGVGVGLLLCLRTAGGAAPRGSASAKANTTFTFQPSGEPLVNPHRGFRHQMSNLCGDSDDPSGRNHVHDGLKVCAELNLTVSLAYCYLSPWWNRTLPDSMLTNLHGRLGEMRAAGVTALLNVAYGEWRHRVAHLQTNPQPSSQ